MAEIEGSLADLEGCGLRRPRFFAYPYGESDRKVERAVEAAGFRAAFTVAPGLVRPGWDPYRLPRIKHPKGRPRMEVSVQSLCRAIAGAWFG